MAEELLDGTADLSQAVERVIEELTGAFMAVFQFA